MNKRKWHGKNRLEVEEKKGRGGAHEIIKFKEPLVLYLLRDWSNVISVGIVPVRVLLYIQNWTMSVSCPTSVGIVPVKSQEPIEKLAVQLQKEMKTKTVNQ